MITIGIAGQARTGKDTSARYLAGVFGLAPAAYVRNRGGLMLHLRRPDAQAVAAHVSENTLPVEPGDVVVHNTGTLADLYEQLNAAVKAHARGL